MAAPHPQAQTGYPTTHFNQKQHLNCTWLLLILKLKCFLYRSWLLIILLSDSLSLAQRESKNILHFLCQISFHNVTLFKKTSPSKVVGTMVKVKLTPNYAMS
jgi:hypothetical protein